MSHTFQKRRAFVAAAMSFGAFAFFFTQQTAADTIYSQNFGSAYAALSTLAWFGYAGSSSADYHSVVYGNGQYTDAGAANTLKGSSDGYAYSRSGLAGSDARALLGTSAFSAIDLSQYNSLTFSWSQQLTSTDYSVHLAINVGNAWYVSVASFTTAAGSWISESVALSSTSWYALTASSSAGWSLSTSATELPTTGSITSAGLYTTGGNTTASVWRFDDFTITGATVPEPSTAMLVVVGAAALLAYARRRRK
jgi:hypothetical protein